MTPEEAHALVIGRDGRPFHAQGAGLTEAEAAALVLKARGARDHELAAALGVTTSCGRGILASGGRKLSAWHLETAKEVIQVVDNKPIREPRLFVNVHGEEEELRCQSESEDDALRIHPDLHPTPHELTAPTRAALSVILEGSHRDPAR